MEKLSGSLFVEEIRGKRGIFCVGTLSTSIGDFKVKDAALDQFRPGTYNGDFLIEKIYTKGVPWRGGFFTELIAKIAPDGFLIDEADHAAPTPQTQVQQVEPDPVDDVPPAALPPTDSGESGVGDESETNIPTDVDLANKADEALFGVELFQQFNVRGTPITLDPTVDRELFRRQRDRLKAVGYRFDSKTQMWHLSAH